MAEARPSKRARTDASTSSSAPSDSTAELKAQYKAAAIQMLTKPGKVDLLVDILVNTGAVNDPCRTSCYALDMNGTKSVRKQRRKFLAKFLACSLRKDGDSYFYDNLILKEILGEHLHLVGDNFWDNFGSRIKGAKMRDEAAREKWELEQGEGDFVAGYDWTWRELNPQALGQRIADSYYGGRPPTGHFQAPFSQSAKDLLREPKFASLVDKWTAQVTPALDLTIKPEHVQLSPTGNGQALLDELKPLRPDIAFFRDKAAPSTIKDAWGTSRPTTDPLGPAVMSKICESYVRPSAPPQGISHADVEAVLSSTRRMHDRNEQDADLRTVVLGERRLRDLSAAQAELLAKVEESRADLGGVGNTLFGVDIKKPSAQPSEFITAYQNFCSTVVDGLDETTSSFFKATGLSDEELVDDLKDAASFYGTSSGADEPALGLEQVEQSGAKPTVISPLSTGEKTVLKEIGSFKLVPGGRGAYGVASQKMKETLDQYKKDVIADPLPTSGGSFVADDDVLDVEASGAATSAPGEDEPSERDLADLEAALANVLDNGRAEIHAAAGKDDGYSVALLARSLLNTFSELNDQGGSFNLSTGVSHFGRARARLFLHLDSLGPLAIELTRICWIAFILSFLLPTAGVAPMWAESAFNRLAAGASTKTQAIIHSLNMDLQGAMISIEVYTTQGMHETSVEEVRNETGRVDPSWYINTVELQGGRCWEHRTCHRKLIYQLGQGRSDNSDGRRLSVSVLQRRKPLPLHDGLPEGSYYNCLYGLYRFLYCPGIALSVARLAVLVHFVDKASRGKGLPGWRATQDDEVDVAVEGIAMDQEEGASVGEREGGGEDE